MAKRKRRTIKKHGPHPTDVHVGGRVRLRRTMLGMSQTELSAAVGLAFQQISQNETGAIRIGAGRLYELSRILDVPVSYFFEGLGGKDEGETTKRETLELVRAYYGIKSNRMRQQLIELVKTAARTGN